MIHTRFSYNVRIRLVQIRTEGKSRLWVLPQTRAKGTIVIQLEIHWLKKKKIVPLSAKKIARNRRGCIQRYAIRRKCQKGDAHTVARERTKSDGRSSTA